MNIKRIALSKLKPSPYNPRKPLKPGSRGWKKLERSIDEFDLVQPLVWNRTTGHVVSGHQRLEILRERGVQSVEVVVVELSQEREKCLNITLNNASVGSSWDFDRLGLVMEDLQDLADFDATLTGFDEREIRDLVLKPVSAPECPPEDAFPERVTVTIEVEVDRWELLRAELDELCQQHDFQLHIDLPSRPHQQRTRE